MMADLFTIGQRSRSSDPQTSHEAGHSVSGFLRAHHEIILKIMRDVGVPMAAQQIAAASEKLTYVQINRRLPELVDLGLIAGTDERYVNESGRGARKYKLARE